MKIGYITGCTYNDLQINNKNAETLDVKDLQEICKKLIDKTTDKDSLQQIIIDYLYQVGPIDSYKCEQCGDWVETFEIEV